MVKKCPFKDKDCDMEECVSYKDTKTVEVYYYDEVKDATVMQANQTANFSACSGSTLSYVPMGTMSYQQVYPTYANNNTAKIYHITKKKVRVNAYCTLTPQSNLGNKTKIVNADENYIVYSYNNQASTQPKLLEWKEKYLKED
jgi:hypothetical protein